MAESTAAVIASANSLSVKYGTQVVQISDLDDVATLDANILSGAQSQDFDRNALVTVAPCFR